MLSPGARGAAPRFDPLLPRPMAVYRTLTGGASPEIEVLYKAAGRGTQLLAEARAGERVRVVGPLGVPFALPAARAPGAAGRRREPVSRRSTNSPRARRRCGARSWSCSARAVQIDLMGCDDFVALGIELRIATEDGSRGHRGRVTGVARRRARRGRRRRRRLCLRSDADDAARGGDRGVRTAAPARCRSRITWPAASASASAARCRAPTARSRWCVATVRSSRRSRVAWAGVP